MKAAVLTETKEPLHLLDLEQESPRRGDVRVKTKATGVCMSDWHLMKGDWPCKLPIVLGHEAAGIVEEIGEGVFGLQRGDHVIFSFHSNCGQCRYCADGRTTLCNGHADTSGWVQFDGTSRLRYRGEPVYQMTRLGTFAEYVVCPAEQVVKVRKDMPFAQAALVGCSVATGVGSVIRHAKIEVGCTVLVIGCGGVGLNIVQGARLAGAKEIIAVDLLDNKLEYAKAFGATQTLNASQVTVHKEVKKLTGGLGVDYAFDAIGSAATVAQIVSALAPGGHAVMVGIPAVDVTATISPSSMVFQEKSLSGSFYGSSRPRIDFPMLCDLYMAGKLNLDELISQTYTLDQVNEGLANLQKGSVARGVIVFD